MTKQAVVGLLAPVDAGKTTLAEGLLYQAGALRSAGRVDKGTAFLDPDALERARGITIFDHQAALPVDDWQLTLLDTPGHVDFTPAVERVLPVLDAAILVVSAKDGIPGHLRTLWHLLVKAAVPTIVFVNKLDQAGADPAKILAQLQTAFGTACQPFNWPDQLAEWPASTAEAVATLGDEALLDAYLESGTVPAAATRKLIAKQQLVPVFFGAALKQSGVKELLAALPQWLPAFVPKDRFAARTFRVSHEADGSRLTWLRVLGGQLAAKQEVAGEKADQLRVYNGRHFTVVPVAKTGQAVAVAGPQATVPGQVLGGAGERALISQQPVLRYQVHGDDPTALQAALTTLADEEPLLHFQQADDRLLIQLLGAVQGEVLVAQLRDRFQLAASLTPAGVVERETILAPVEGVGHFEPLRHYAEVHLLLVPLPAGRGIELASNCREEVLPHNWQTQILTALAAKEHRGVLVGAPLTDVKVTLVGGRGNLKHTSGGDFRQAAWRAVRQGLMTLRAHQQVQLLHPWYAFELTLPQDQVGRGMADLQRFGGQVEPPQAGEAATVTLTGTAPVAALQDYALTVRNYTHGQGNLTLRFAGFRPAAAPAVTNYDPVGDLDNPPGSVFCAHGAGYPVAWDQVPATMHCPWVYPDLMKKLPVGG